MKTNNIEQPGIARVIGPVKETTTTASEINLPTDTEKIQRMKVELRDRHEREQKALDDQQARVHDKNRPFHVACQRRHNLTELMARGKEQEKSILAVKAEAQEVLVSLFGDYRYAGRAVAFNRPAADLASFEITLNAFAKWYAERQKELEAAEAEIRSLAKQLDVQHLIPADMTK